MKFLHSALFLLTITASEAFAPNSAPTKASTSLNAQSDESSISRQDFISAAIAASVGSAMLLPVESAQARGRATLEYSYDRYYPRLEAGGIFYAKDLRQAIAKNDWAAIKVSLKQYFF